MESWGWLSIVKGSTELRTRQDVLLPMLPAQEILSRQFALSKRCSTFKKGDIHTGNVFLLGLLGDLFNDHLAHKGDWDAPYPVYHVVGAWHGSPGEIRSIARLRLRRVFTGLRDELLQTHRDVVRDPRLDALNCPGRIGTLVLELLREADEQRFQTC
jgi:hypothetical protein